jgi:dTDP-glucose 4,6-dehydratase
MSNFKKHVLITGGAGFIGSHVVRLFVKNYPDYNIINLDSLTYAGNLANLSDLENEANYTFLKADICDNELMTILKPFEITDIIHLAAESHVDRSISDPLSFVKTNVLGTANLLDFARKSWTDNIDEHLFYHVSTDEVYGSLGESGLFTETTAYDPRSPYSASKASSDHLVRAYNHTFGLPTIISNCSNNYGSHQFPEKLIPLLIKNCKQNLPLPIYGKGENIRDWLWVEDHARAIDVIFHTGKVSETYNIGGINEWKNIDLVHLLCDLVDQKLNREIGTSKKLITFVTDRQGHDARYAIDASKLENELNWTPSIQFEEGLSATINWYLANEKWIENVTSGTYASYYEAQYNQR